MPRLKKPAINSIIFELENGEIESSCSSTDEDRLHKVDCESTNLNEESSNSMKPLANGSIHEENVEHQGKIPAILPSLDCESSQSTNSAIKFESKVLRTPIVTVKFKDKRTAKAYKLKVKKYIMNLVTKSSLKSSASIACDTDSDTELNIWSSDDESKKTFKADDTTDAFDTVLSSNSIPSTIDEDDGKGNDMDSESHLFVFDTKPGSNDDRDMPPCYRKKFDILDNSVNEKPADSQISVGRGKCFNCNGAHSLRDCPEPRNYQRINQNRKEMMNRPGRYHVEEQNKAASSNDSVIAGRISGALRQALGLHKNQLPRHIYRMRQLGYPPGWLINAKITHSGISIFDSEGKEVADPEDEDGELIQEGSKDKYDCKKILDFPGFNVPPSSRYTDESEFHGCPPLSENDSKLVMLEHLAPKMAKAYRRKKLISLQQSSEKMPGDMNVHTDMDLDDQAGEENELEMLRTNGFGDTQAFIPPLPSLPVPSPPPPPPPTCLPGEEPARARISPSLDDLESRKMLLLAALDEGSHDSPAKISPQSPVTLEAPLTPLSKTELEATVSNPITPVTPRVGEVRDSSLGTPMMSSATPYHRLPTDVSFSKDICDVINFENLPDSTGKYLQMSSIIMKVRKVVSKIQEDQ